jgi:hypothetical protein
VQENHIVVRWQWLFLLAIQIGFTIIFLPVVIYQTARLGIDIVKSSNMAELFALQDTQHCDAPPTDDRGQVIKSAGINTQIDSNTTAELIKGNGGWKLYLQ